MIEKFNKVVQRYAERQTLNAIRKAEEEKCGKGCGCPTCVKKAIYNANDWISWSSPEESPYKDNDVYWLGTHRGKVSVEGGFTGDEILGRIQKRLNDGREGDDT